MLLPLCVHYRLSALVRSSGGVTAVELVYLDRFDAVRPGLSEVPRDSGSNATGGEDDKYLHVDVVELTDGS